MKNPFGDIRTGEQRIFIGFLTYSLVSLCVSVVSFSLFRQLEDLEKANRMVNQFYSVTLDGINTGKDFFIYSTTNDNFFRLGESEPLDEHKEIMLHINELREQMKNEKKLVNFLGVSGMQSFDSLLVEYQSLFDSIVSEIVVRGYRDFGYVGEMRSHIHRLEGLPWVDQLTLLQIRRYEKDYLIRRSPLYIRKLSRKCSQMAVLIEQNKQVSESERRSALRLLNNYERAFKNVVKMDIAIGNHDRTGLTLRLEQCSQQLDWEVSHFYVEANREYERIFENFQIVTVVVVTISVILTLLLSLGFKHIFQ